MDPEAAFSALDLTAPTSAEAIRRAYLRGVRAHSPERDPTGFRRIRDAYELLKDAPWFWGGARVLALAPVARQFGPGPAAEVDEPAVDDADDEASFEAVPSGPFATLQQLLASGELERAAGVLLEAMADQRVAAEPPFTAWQVYETVLGLFERSQFELGGRVLAWFDHWVTQRGMPPSAFGPALIAQFALLNEVRMLYGSVRDPLLKALAVAIRRRDFSYPASALWRARTEQGGFEHTFRSAAPSLYAATWPLLQEDVVLPRGMRYPRWSYVGLVFIGLQVVRMAVSTHTTHPAEQRRSREFAASTEGPARSTTTTRPFVAAEDLDESIRVGACPRVRELWPLYVTAGSKGGDSQAFERGRDERRATAIAMCPELAGELP